MHHVRGLCNSVSDVDRCRLRWMRNIVRFDSVSSRAKKMSSLFRARAADSWANLRAAGRDVPQPEPCPPPTPPGDLVDVITALLSDDNASADRCTEHNRARLEIRQTEFDDLPPTPNVRRAPLPFLHMSAEHVETIRVAIQSRSETPDVTSMEPAVGECPALPRDLESTFLPNEEQRILLQRVTIGCKWTACIAGIHEQASPHSRPCVCSFWVVLAPASRFSRTNCIGKHLPFLKLDGWCLLRPLVWQRRAC